MEKHSWPNGRVFEENSETMPGPPRPFITLPPQIVEVLREHEDGNGFTLTTLDPQSAFRMAEKMAFSGNHYSIKLSGQKGGEWVVVVREVAIKEVARGFCDCNQGRLPCTCRGMSS
jgi:hypothetical protein